MSALVFTNVLSVQTITVVEVNFLLYVMGMACLIFSPCHHMTSCLQRKSCVRMNWFSDFRSFTTSQHGSLLGMIVQCPSSMKIPRPISTSIDCCVVSGRLQPVLRIISIILWQESAPCKGLNFTSSEQCQIFTWCSRVIEVSSLVDRKIYFFVRTVSNMKLLIFKRPSNCLVYCVAFSCLILVVQAYHFNATHYPTIDWRIRNSVENRYFDRIWIMDRPKE